MSNEDQAERIKRFWDQPEVKEWLEPYEDGRTLEPLLHWSLIQWSLMHGGGIGRIRSVVVLQDWFRPERDDQGRVEPQNYENWINGCYNWIDGTTGPDTEHDKTLNPLFLNSYTTQEGVVKWSSCWSAEEMARGDLVAMNAAPGLRTVNVPASTGDLGEALHTAAMNIYWLPLIKTMEPEIVYLCGRWALPLMNDARDALGQAGVRRENVIHHCHPSTEFRPPGGPRWTRHDRLS